MWKNVCLVDVFPLATFVGVEKGEWLEARAARVSRMIGFDVLRKSLSASMKLVSFQVILRFPNVPNLKEADSVSS
jgi:hypothetical protein